MSDHRVARLRLIRTPGIGPITYRQLLARFGRAEAAIDALPGLATRGGGRSPNVVEAKVVEREIATVEKLGAHYLFLDDPAYPPLLAELDNAPAVFTYRGDLGLTERTVVAMVGARNASAAACRFARGLAVELGREGVVVASGLARGLDTAAHSGALATGTIGVIASGIDIAFPPENRELQEAVATQGLLIAEQSPGMEPLARNFPHRNRIIAGLAVGTVVVEAAPRSGSLITARLANEAGRDVMAVPGSPLDPRAQGCNQLIRDGATLVQSAADILETVRPIDARMVRSPTVGFGAAPAAEPDDSDRRRLADLLGPVPVAIDELIRQSALPPAAVATILLELELAGRLDRHAGGRVSLA
ncbi:MAG: DNA-processing protein DprA [Sphingomonas sp.]|uniref:DNA-processing protein DprA n=1 Tax=Sphingomonas sp. TaxID=28214 RepID=UPI001AD342D3|nr:DNA-processing protein DprA [Sphingomonas sp.]MBN8809078.1 DNA-processing protein DprA [Sphingomonas sp.]